MLALMICLAKVPSLYWIQLLTTRFECNARETHIACKTTGNAYIWFIRTYMEHYNMKITNKFVLNWDW